VVPLLLIKEHGQSLFENKGGNKISGSKKDEMKMKDEFGCRKLQTEELQNV
jgi:hypothetical protein